MSDNNKKPVVKGELLSYGFAPYQNDPTQRQSYFVEIKHDNGIAKKEWGVDLERALNESNVQIGDTVILNNLGRQPVNISDPQDETKTKTVTKNLWEVEKYEPVLDLPNVIEHDTEREQEKTVAPDKKKENEQDDPSAPNQAKKVPDLSEFDFKLPDNIKNNYFGIVKNRYLLDQKTNYYDKDDKNQVNIAFEDRNKSLHTSRQDEKTIYAMLDMAQAKNWTAIKLKGTEEFKQKAWLEASLRGIEVKGYEPNEKDLAQLKARQTERTTNKVEMTAQKTPEPKQAEAKKEQSESPIPEMTEEDTAKYSVTPHRLNEALIDTIVKNVQEYNKNQQKIQENLQKDNIQNNSNLDIPQKNVDDVDNIAKKAKEVEAVKIEAKQEDGLDESTLKMIESLDTKKVQNLSKEDFNKRLKNIEDPLKDSNYLVFQALRTGNENWITEAKHIADLNKKAYLSVDDVYRRYDLSEEIREFLEKKEGHQEKDVSTKEINQEQTSQKSAKDIKKDIRQIFQAGYKDGSIKSRDELVEVLKERGFEVKENDKSIRVSLPNSDQAVNLKGEVFTKGYDAIKSLKERLEPETLKQTYPTLTDGDIVHITAYKNKLFDNNKDMQTPKALQASLVRLEDSVKDMAKGQNINLPNLPVNEIKPDIKVRTTDNHNKSRQV